MSVYPIPHDEHVYQRENFLNRDPSALKPLTVERALQWLNHPTWKRHEAILIFDGHDPESRRFYEEDGASVSLAQLLHLRIPLQMERPFKFYFNWIKKHRIPLPPALQQAMEIVNICKVARVPQLTPTLQVPPAPQITPASQVPPPTKIEHRNSTVSGNRNILTPVIQHAQSRCNDQWDEVDPEFGTGV